MLLEHHSGKFLIKSLNSNHINLTFFSFGHKLAFMLKADSWQDQLQWDLWVVYTGFKQSESVGKQLHIYWVIICFLLYDQQNLTSIDTAFTLYYITGYPETIQTISKGRNRCRLLATLYFYLLEQSTWHCNIKSEKFSFALRFHCIIKAHCIAEHLRWQRWISWVKKHVFKKAVHFRTARKQSDG